jgi:hypothetical protein
MAATMASNIAFPIAVPFSLARHCTANIKPAATGSQRSGSRSHHYPSNEQSIFSYLGPIGSHLDAMTSQQRASLLDLRQTVGLDHIAFAVDPFGLRRIEPRTLLVNKRAARDPTTTTRTMVNGKITRNEPLPGTYSVKANCTGTLTFTNGTRYDIFIAPDGSMFTFVRTNPELVSASFEQRGMAKRVGE